MPKKTEEEVKEAMTITAKESATVEEIVEITLHFTKSLFEGKLKDWCLHKITITEGLNQATQLKKIYDALPVLYTEKKYKFFKDVVCNNQQLDKATFMPVYPDPSRWSKQIFVKTDTIDQNGVANATIGVLILLIRTYKNN